MTLEIDFPWTYEDMLLANLLKGLSTQNKLSILTEKEIQQIYFLLLKQGITDSVQSLKERTGIKPSKKVSIKAQKFNLKRGKVYGIPDIQEVTGTKPTFNKELVYDAYKKLNKVKGGSLIILHIIRKIHKFTGIKAPKKIIYSWYKTLMKNNSLQKIKRLEYMTKVKSQYHIEVEFLLALKRGDFRTAKDLYKTNKKKLNKFKKIEDIFERLDM